MILVNKPAAIPKKLLDAVAKTTAIKRAYTLDKTPTKSKFIKNLKIDPKIYGNKAIKKALKKAQNNKCCFCEKDQVDEYGDVEHYRPKRGYKSTRKDKIVRPGYYWLVYDWLNLFFVCGKCNKTFKGNLFPLRPGSPKANSHHDNIQDEDPLLLNPCGKKDPRKHIYFNGPLPMHYDEYGQRTIDICGLDRDELNNKREKLINDIETRIWIVKEPEKFSADKVKKATSYLVNCIKPEAEFSAMAADFLKDNSVEIA